ncbi:MAG: hypothetical protein KatS3mg057_1312 [Herpetosiphonaceae bacterium]|nr:MAG: hypothetical protein KatS3mg057_1312 [Herpetosiphonaceae bacterium]
MREKADNTKLWREAREIDVDHGLEPEHGDEEQRHQAGERTPSSAPNTSFETGAGAAATGFDSPAIGSVNLPNPEVEGVEHQMPYYPPGSDTGPVSQDKAEDEAERSQDRA